MEFKVLMVLLFSILFINGSSLTTHQEQANSYHLAKEHWLGFASMPRKLLLNQKVEVFGDKDLLSYSTAALSGQSHKGRDAASEETMQEGSDPTPLFTMDYTPVRRRRPVHNKSFPATTASP